MNERSIYEDIDVLEQQVLGLLQEVKSLRVINEEHRKLNGALRAELKVFYNEPIPPLADGDIPDECILCGTKLKEIKANGV